MRPAPRPGNELRRIAELHALRILDTAPEAPFERIVRVAAELFDVPIVQVSLVAEDREWFKASCGTVDTGGPRDTAFCAHTILSAEVLVVEDATQDPRFRESPLVVEKGVRFYAGAPLAAPSGVNLGALCVKDMQPRSFTESQRSTLQDLAATVVDLILHRSLAEQAKAASEAKSRFLANMSHELRTPLTAILGYADMLAAEDADHRARRTHIAAIRRSGEHLLSMVNDILDASTLDSGFMELECLPTDPAQVVTEVVDLLKPTAANRGVALSVVYESMIPRVMRCDPARLRQVLLKLVGNAIKFTERGAITVGVRLDSGGETGAQLVLSVRDTGIGIPADQIPQLFQPFSQADSSTTRRFGGTGLGLAIARDICRRLGGDLTAAARVGGGSEFRASVAVDAAARAALWEPAPAETRAAAPPTVDSPLAECRVLLAEDGPDNQRLIAHVLRKAGASVRIVPNGRAAIQALTVDGQIDGPLRRPTPFDLFLMDMQMPEMDGYEATRTLRDRGLDRPIIALTANAMAGDRERCLAAGCNAYLSKPVERAALIAACMRELGRLTPPGREVSASR